ncbi:MAG TPA: glycosyltransferase family 39 protein, partial [Polyangiaceae bacterium]|nr:glycosyltransferase family 39 protein [Polyangiaceae bacterium]
MPLATTLSEASGGLKSARSALQRWLFRAMLAATAILTALRFCHLDADFPLGINWSGDVYTDEGWYANSAVRHYLFGYWYLQGDFNPMVVMPVAQLMDRMALSLFGLGVGSVRILVALASLVVITLTGLIVRRSFGDRAGALTALIIAASYPTFAFSRLGIVEPIGTALVVASLYVADTSGGGRPWRRLIAAALLLVSAALAKSTMAFAFPLVAHYAWSSGRNPRHSLLLALASVVLILGSLGLYHLLISHVYAADYQSFRTLNVDERKVRGIAGWLVNVVRKLGQMFYFGGAFVGVAAVLIAAAALLVPAFKRSSLVRVLVAYVILYLGILTPIWYGPPRYFVPFMVPLAGLTAIACIGLTTWLGDHERYHRLALAPAVAVAAIVLAGIVRIAGYVSRPHYTFREMTAGVGDIIRKRGGSATDTTVVGHMADSIALQTGIRAMNSKLGTV